MESLHIKIMGRTVYFLPPTKIPARWHKSKRINKKMLKKRGLCYVEIDVYKSYICDLGIYMTKKAYNRIKEELI